MIELQNCFIMVRIAYVEYSSSSCLCDVHIVIIKIYYFWKCNFKYKEIINEQIQISEVDIIFIVAIGKIWHNIYSDNGDRTRTLFILRVRVRSGSAKVRVRVRSGSVGPKSWFRFGSAKMPNFRVRSVRDSVRFPSLITTKGPDAAASSAPPLKRPCWSRKRPCWNRT